MGKIWWSGIDAIFPHSQNLDPNSILGLTSHHPHEYRNRKVCWSWEVKGQIPVTSINFTTKYLLLLWELLVMNNRIPSIHIYPRVFISIFPLQFLISVLCKWRWWWNSFPNIPHLISVQKPASAWCGVNGKRYSVRWWAVAVAIKFQLPTLNFDIHKLQIFGEHWEIHSRLTMHQSHQILPASNVVWLMRPDRYPSSGWDPGARVFTCRIWSTSNLDAV